MNTTPTTTPTIINKTITEIVDNELLDYSMYVLQNRAIPSVADGLKNGGRKLVYSMLTEYPTRKVKVAELGASIAKCVTPETLIEVNGVKMPIVELHDTFKQGDVITAYDDSTNQLCQTPVLGVYQKYKSCEFYTITTANGEVTVTGDHKFLLTDGNWVMAKDLTLDMELKDLQL